MGLPQKKTYHFNSKIDKSWNLELQDFYEEIKRKRKSSPGIIDSYKNLKIIDIIYKNKL